jgi:hypothetical protein
MRKYLNAFVTPFAIGAPGKADRTDKTDDSSNG